MKKLTLILCAALISSMLVSSAAAGSTATLLMISSQDKSNYSHEEAGVKFQLPKGWKAEPDGAVITVSTPDDSLQMVFWVPDDDSFDAAVKDLDNELGKTIKNIKTTGKETKTRTTACLITARAGPAKSKASRLSGAWMFSARRNR